MHKKFFLFVMVMVFVGCGSSHQSSNSPVSPVNNYLVASCSDIANGASKIEVELSEIESKFGYDFNEKEVAININKSIGQTIDNLQRIGVFVYRYKNNNPQSCTRFSDLELRSMDPYVFLSSTYFVEESFKGSKTHLRSTIFGAFLEEDKDYKIEVPTIIIEEAATHYDLIHFYIRSLINLNRIAKHDLATDFEKLTTRSHYRVAKIWKDLADDFLKEVDDRSDKVSGTKAGKAVRFYVSHAIEFLRRTEIADLVIKAYLLNNYPFEGSSKSTFVDFRVGDFALSKARTLKKLNQLFNLMQRLTGFSMDKNESEFFISKKKKLRDLINDLNQLTLKPELEPDRKD